MGTNCLSDHIWMYMAMDQIMPSNTIFFAEHEHPFDSYSMFPKGTEF